MRGPSGVSTVAVPENFVTKAAPPGSPSWAGAGEADAEHDDRQKRNNANAPTMFPSRGA